MRRREFLTGAAGVVVAGCMGDGGEGGDGGGSGDGGNGDGGGDNTTGASGAPPDAEVSVSFDKENYTVRVSLESVTNADYVEVNFDGEAIARGRLNEVGDAVVLGNESLSTEGSAEDATREIGRFGGTDFNDEVRVTATAVRGNRSEEVYNETDFLGPRFITATVDHLFDSENDRVRVVYRSKDVSEYVEVEFMGDARAKGRLNEAGDELVLTSDGLNTSGEAENLTESLDGADDGDTVRVVARGFKMNESTVVLDKQGTL